MAEDMEQSSESIATSDEFEMVGGAEVDGEHKTVDQIDGSTNEPAAIEKPVTLEFVQLSDKSSKVTKQEDVTVLLDGCDTKALDKINGRQEKCLKGEPVTRHPLASPLSPQALPGLIVLKEMSQEKKLATLEENGKVPHGKLQCNGSSSPSPEDETSVSQSSSLQFGETDCTLFPHVTYLGCAAINAPRSEKEIQRNMAILNEQALDQAIEVTLSVPSHSEGSVTFLESDSTNEIASFSIHRILFCARGLPETREKECFAFACSHGNTAETAIFQCHVFKCDSPETVVKLLQTFKIAFCRIPKLTLTRGDSISSDKGAPIGMSIKNYQHVYIYDTTVDIKEEDLKGNFVSCPREKDYFKLRCDLEKMITVTVNQTSNNKELIIQRCFGLLVSPGRNLGDTDMHILEGVVMNRVLSGDKALYHISANWNPDDAVFEILNTVTPRDHQVYFTVAVDLVFSGIEEPVRFVIETKAKIFAPNERFWNFTRRVLHEQFYLRVKEIDNENCKEAHFEVMSLHSAMPFYVV